ncbi:MFS transporter [Kitasatospora sp. NPDC059571]|uniref:MFS transporter n=1 Tax=Kitasatospora sp. NPDC059571 TaxID=3346871 RepID=UPI0036825780
MFASYRRILALPGALAFTLAGLLARLALSMSGVATVTLIADRRGSYALAGAVSAAGLAAVAVGMPLLGRLVDRHGQARVAVPAVLGSSVPLAGLLLCTRFGAPAWTLFACWALASGVPNLGGMARARWAHLLQADEAARHLANSLEQALDELCFMAGPVLAVLLCRAFFPEAGLLVSGVLCAAGVLLFAAQRGTEPPVRPAVRRAAHRPEGGSGPAGRGLRVLLPAFLATGVVFGAMEVTTIAYTDALGHGSAAGPLLALVAAGSCASGLFLGLVRPRRSAAVRLLAGAGAMAGLLLLPAAAGLAGAGPWVLGAALFVAGSGTAPTMVSGMTLVQEVVPAERLNEGMSAAVSAIVVGISAGSALGGAVAQRAAPGTGYWVPAGAAATALLIVAAGLPVLRRPAGRAAQAAEMRGTPVGAGG